MVEDIKSWASIKDRFNGTILLGNGASIAVDDRFGYGTLKKYVIDNKLLKDDVKRIFDSFETDDFELILRIVWQASNVNTALGIEESITKRSYGNIRDALISTVRNIHPTYQEVSEKIQLIHIFIKHFKYILSLNYDLLVYWAVAYNLDNKDNHALKDCFCHGEFNDDWEEFGNPINNQTKCSLVFYPHGNLILARDKVENEIKITVSSSNLLESILDKWKKGTHVPLFVSEGIQKQKETSIHSSHYLNTVYRKVLANCHNNLTIYGWGFGEQDLHMLDRLKKSKIQRIAVSVYKNDQSFCSKVRSILTDKLGSNCEVNFFDSESKGCWIHN